MQANNEHNTAPHNPLNIYPNPNNPPNNDELWKHISELNDRLSIIEHRHGYVSSAFPQNDLGKPDYDGHRRSHLQLIEDSKVVQGYKSEVTKTILSIVAGAVLAIFASGLIAHIKVT